MPKQWAGAGSTPKNLFTLPCPRGRLPEQRVPRCLLLDVLYLTWQWAVPWQYPICFPLFPGVMSAGSREGGRSPGASRRAEHHRARLGLPTAAGDGDGTYTPLCEPLHQKRSLPLSARSPKACTRYPTRAFRRKALAHTSTHLFVQVRSRNDAPGNAGMQE